LIQRGSLDEDTMDCLCFLRLRYRWDSCFCAVVVLFVLAGTVRADGLGASFDAAGGVNFSVFSAAATRVEVWVYANPQGDPEKLALPMVNNATTHVWSLTVSATDLTNAGVIGPVFYGYRAWGPNWPFATSWKKGSADGFVVDVDDQGNRFNPNKLLLDPYAREVSHDPRTPSQPDGSIYFSGPAQRTTDTGDKAPKGVVLKPDATSFGTKPTRTLKDDIIYEVHLRGLTKIDSSIPAAIQGTYAGAALKAADLKGLGITAIEFLPIFELQNDANGIVPGSAANDDYWGYDPNSFFSPDRHYASDQSWGGPTREFKSMVRAFHDVGIKVILDVVYNHTGEGDVDAATGTIGRILSWRGLDNATYYELRDNINPKNVFAVNGNGVGPNYNAGNRVARELMLDSLKHWSNEMGVDGFRFDLAALLGNSQTRNGMTFDNTSPDGFLLRAVKELPARKADGTGVELIAEPYGDGVLFNLGNFPLGWSEWDDRYRKPIRQAQNKLGVGGFEVTPGQLTTLFAGSSDLFAHNGRKPFNGINYVVVHDGFNLRDLYSFNDALNSMLVFPFGPSSGGGNSNDNLSWDQGGDPALQRQAARTGMALLLVSAGVPLIVGGDEMYRTQFGNNNPVNLDNAKFYLDYSLRAQFRHHFNYAAAMLGFRQGHAALRRAGFFDGQDHNGNGLKDVTWIRDNGQEADGGYLGNNQNHFIGFRLDGTEVGDSSASIFIAYNSFFADITATFPANLPGNHWFLVADTSASLEAQDNIANPPRRIDSLTYNTTARSVAIFVEQP
jgi:glycogen operon protein